MAPESELKEELSRAFLEYARAIQSLSKPVKEHKVVELPPIESRQRFAQENVSRFEQLAEFETVARAAQRHIAPAETGLLFIWRDRLGNFFRLSGFYEGVLFGEMPDSQQYFELFVSSFRSNQDVTLYAPLEHVSFSSDAMDFRDFKIQKFKKDELDIMFKQAVCKQFFPQSRLSTGDLADYWFIVCNDQLTKDEQGGWGSLSA